MKVLIRKSATACAVALFATMANASNYECNFPQKAANGGWIPEFVLVYPIDGTREAVVFDPIIEEFVGDPIEAKVSADNSTRVTYIWDFKAQNKNQYARMNYRLTIQKASRKASITGQAIGFEGPYSAEGKCVVIKD